MVDNRVLRSSIFLFARGGVPLSRVLVFVLIYLVHYLEVYTVLKNKMQICVTDHA